MHHDPNHNIDETAIHHLEVLSLYLNSDPEIIALMPIEEVTEELLEIGINPQVSKNLRGLSDEDISKAHEKKWEIENRLKILFEVSKEEFFEEGVENSLSEGLISLIHEYGTDLIPVLGRLISYGRVNEEISSEALRWLARLEHPASYDERLSLLEESLKNPSARIRDAASIGLATLDDPNAIPYLKQAIQQETYSELRDDMRQILELLEKTH